MPGKPGSFAAYLEYTQRHRTSPAGSRIALSRIEEPVDLLRLLGLQPEGSMSIGQLATVSGRSAGAFHQFLRASSEAGLLQVEGPTLEETVTVTPKGRERAKLA